MAFEGMIFAAGLGTRLRPLTDDRPKALVEVAGIPMLERVARRLVDAGATRLVVNVHPFADRIRDFVEAKDGFGVEVLFSHERDRPLETGGGLVLARDLLGLEHPTVLHNVDVLSDIDLAALVDTHERTGADATLAVMDRDTSRKLLFDEGGLLGRVDEGRDLELTVRMPEGELHALAFQGIHVVSPALVRAIDERGAFSILDPYLRLAREGLRILPHRVDGCRWIDIGRPEHLARAEAWFDG